MHRVLAAFLVLNFLPLFISAQLRVEPMNWWTGMKNPGLQLLVHGNGIGETVPSIQYPGVRIIKTHKADSKNYLFLDLEISKSAKPGTFPILFKKQGKLVESFNYSLKERSAETREQQGFSASDVIYLITPDRFANGSTANDAVASMRETTVKREDDYGRHGGDLRGIIQNLDYIASMGYTAIWMTPVLENDMRSSSYHGYAITDHYKVDPRFGTMDEYRELANKARQKGIKMVFDAVANHTGSEYWWMRDLPFRNWINYPDSMLNTNHRRTVNQDLYAAEADRQLMVRGWFVRSMPDMNQENPFVENYLIQNNIWWIEELGLGGIRQDTYPYSEKKFLANWTCRITNEYPGFAIVAEEWTTNPLLVAYWQQGKNKTTGCLKSTMDFPLQAALVQALTEPEAWDKGIVKLYESLSNDFVYASPKDLLVFGDNHDMDRLFTQLKNDPALQQMALAFLLTVRGIPQIYYGTEILLHNTGKPGDHGRIRSEFPGTWPGDTVNGFTGEGLNSDQLAMQDYTRKLLNWRKNKKTIHNGNTRHFAPDNGAYVYFRYDKADTVMVVMNKTAEPVILNLARFTEMIKNRKLGRDVTSGRQYILSEKLTVSPKTALVLELE